VLELGCGTGRWTERLAARARTVTALDGSEAMLRQARQRLAGGPSTVTFERIDILRAWAPDEPRYDAVAAFFFLEHVPDAHIDDLLRRLSSSLRPGAAVFVAEGRHRAAAPEVEHRHLHDHEYRVVERRRTPEEFTTLFARHGIDATVGVTERLFCFVSGQKVAAAS
jgi:2-polyprenyl-3-methyl-5-hydroxy-6-metoxy-1,4-benzoquinol methylase